MDKFFNKRGSFSIFATMLFVSLAFAVFSIINASGTLAIHGTINSFGTIWGKSILGEYDLFMKNRYGIFAFYEEKTGVEEKLQKYIDYSLKNKSYIKYSKVQCDLKGYSLINTDNLEKQINMITLEGIKPQITLENTNGTDVERTINSLWIIKNLPSYNKTEKLYITGIANKIKEGISFSKIIGAVTTDKYIFDFFKDYMEGRDLGETYFKCEVEYIITGKYSDEKNKNYTGDKIILLRNILNLYYLYSCEEKRNSSLAIAEIISPGAMAFITQGVLLEAWAYAEAKNDLKILYDNKAVALLKDDLNWALSIENVFDIDENGQVFTKEEKESYILPQKTEGILYSDYLRLLLQGVPEKTKLLRILDLIQINAKYLYRDYFLVRDCHCGLTYSFNVNGDRYEFDDEYVQRK